MHRPSAEEFLLTLLETVDDLPPDLAQRFAELLPGVVLLLTIGYSGRLIELSFNAYGKANHLALPNIEYVLWAIAIGLIVSNTVGVPKIFKPGIATYEFFLKFGIVLLGVRFLVGDVLKLGGISLVAVVLELAISIALMTWLGRTFKLSPKLTSLLAVGSSICGVSAIIAAKGAINARDEDASFAIAAILALGAFGLFAYPLIGHFVSLTDHAYGLWAGLSIDNTAEAVAAGNLWSEQAGKVAVGREVDGARVSGEELGQGLPGEAAEGGGVAVGLALQVAAFPVGEVGLPAGQGLPPGGDGLVDGPGLTQLGTPRLAPRHHHKGRVPRRGTVLLIDPIVSDEVEEGGALRQLGG